MIILCAFVVDISEGEDLLPKGEKTAGYLGLISKMAPFTVQTQTPSSMPA